MTRTTRVVPFCAIGALALNLALIPPATAWDLPIGFKAETAAADPHVLGASNRNIATQLHEPLLSVDARMKPKPGRAESWKVVAPPTWEFKPRPGVKLHDDSPLTVFSRSFPPSTTMPEAA